MSHVILIPAVLSTKQCHDYVGGVGVWKDLLKHHAAILKPVRTVTRGDSHYLRQTVENALFAAEMQGTLLASNDGATTTAAPVLIRNNRRFKTGKLSPA